MPAPSFADSPTGLLPRVTEAAGRVLATIERLGEDEVRGPSRLPGWSRAHVLAHLNRGADSRVRLLESARTGRVIRQYPDEAYREREIEQWAGRSLADLVADFRVSDERLRAAIADHPADCWGRNVRWLGAEERSVDDVVPSRLRELEVHHVDLDAGYGPRDWPDWFVQAELPGVVDGLRDRPEVPDLRLVVSGEDAAYQFGARPTRTVEGESSVLLAWLTGRGDGGGLTVEPAGPLPQLPDWK
ncbi:maleylpyruvate isomerase family mycothiol-dependent enzyme [Micromonospora sp. NPDC049175]|uniref:maleylpyruvate isomerase family mycothiol-dependent enzyme n=1 Tax=Micromonospora sp. NPDC049175 TaxID=3364266 RepID=UPI003723EF64